MGAIGHRLLAIECGILAKLQQRQIEHGSFQMACTTDARLKGIECYFSCRMNEIVRGRPDLPDPEREYFELSEDMRLEWVRKDFPYSNRNDTATNWIILLTRPCRE
jgi:hypothetical protein